MVSLIYHYYASVKTLQAVAKELNGKLGEDWGWKGPRKGRGEGFAQAGSSSPCDWRPRNTRVGCGLMRLVLKLTSVRWSLMIWRPSQYGGACRVRLPFAWVLVIWFPTSMVAFVGCHFVLPPGNLYRMLP